MTCTHCNDTGSLSKDVDGYLDCTHCDVATERTVLEHWVLKNTMAGGGLTTAWLIYQHGKAAAAAR